jgi:Zn finger protein HypA/HybF involved in hydrogenase expression
MSSNNTSSRLKQYALIRFSTEAAQKRAMRAVMAGEVATAAAAGEEEQMELLKWDASTFSSATHSCPSTVLTRLADAHCVCATCLAYTRHTNHRDPVECGMCKSKACRVLAGEHHRLAAEYLLRRGATSFRAPTRDMRVFHEIMAMHNDDLEKLGEDFRNLLRKRDREDARRNEDTQEFLARNSGDSAGNPFDAIPHRNTSQWRTANNTWMLKRRRTVASSAPIPIPQPGGWTPFGTDRNYNTALLAGNAAFQRSCAGNGKEEPVRIGSPPSAHSKAFEYGLP